MRLHYNSSSSSFKIQIQSPYSNESSSSSFFEDRFSFEQKRLQNQHEEAAKCKRKRNYLKAKEKKELQESSQTSSSTQSPFLMNEELDQEIRHQLQFGSSQRSEQIQLPNQFNQRNSQDTSISLVNEQQFNSSISNFNRSTESSESLFNENLKKNIEK